MSKKATETTETTKATLTGNLDKSYTIAQEIELEYYHVMLINPRTDEYGVPVEQPRKVILTQAEYQEQAKVGFYGYQVKVLHDPTIKSE